MALNTLASQGVRIYRRDEGSENFIEIAQVVNIGEIGAEASLEDVTTLTSTLREYRKQIPDGTELELEMIFNPADTMHIATLEGDLAANDPSTFAVEYPPEGQETYQQFGGLVMSVKRSVEIDTQIRLMVGLKLTGAIATPASIQKPA